MATFYRRLQVNPVIWGFRVSLADFASAAVIGVAAGLGVGAVVNLYELDFTGVSLIPTSAGVVAFYFLCAWFRKEGDGVVRKDGKFRFLTSRQINRVLIPDRAGAEELFIVVYGSGDRPKGSFVRRFFKGLAYGLKLETKPLEADRVPGTSYCSGLDRKER